MESPVLNAPQLHAPKPQGLRISVAHSPARQSQIISSPASPARSITDAIKSGSHKTLFATATEHQEQQGQQEQHMSEAQELDFGLPPPSPAQNDRDGDKAKPRDIGMDGRGNQTVDFFDMDSSDAEEADKSASKKEGNPSPKSSAVDDTALKPPVSLHSDHQGASSIASSFKPDAEGFADFLKLLPEQMNADSGIGMGYDQQPIFNLDVQPQHANYQQYHANDSSFQPSLSDVRPTSDGTLFNGHEDLVYPTEELRREYQDQHSDKGYSRREILYNQIMQSNDKIVQSNRSILQTEEAIAKYESRRSRKSKKSRSATGRSTPREFGSAPASVHDGKRASSAIPTTNPKGILRVPAFDTTPPHLSSTSSKRRSMSSPTPPLPRSTTPPVPQPPLELGLSRRQSTVPPHISTSAAPRAYVGGPLHTPFPFEDEESKAPEDPPEQQPKSGRAQSSLAPRVHIAEPSAHLRHSIANPDLRRKSRAMSVAVSSNTILALSARRRYAPSGRAITRLIVPADTELAWPAISRRTSQAQGRRMSTATTNPDSTEKPEEPANKKASDFDDGALFRSIRAAYFNELLGTSLPARLWRRYLSARTLKRITLLNPATLSRAENGTSTSISRRKHAGLTDTMSEAKLLSHFRVPNQGRARYAWVAWIHRIAGEVDEDNEEFASRLEAQNTDGEKQRISAVPGGLEFVEGWSVVRVLIAVFIVVAVSGAICLVYVVRGPVTSGGVLVDVVGGERWNGVLGLGTNRDKEGRVVAGAVLGLLMFWVGCAGLGVWGLASWLEM